MILQGDKEITEIPGIEKVMLGDKRVWPVSYIRLVPDIIWLTPWAMHDVLSNTDWRIENT